MRVSYSLTGRTYPTLTCVSGFAVRCSAVALLLLGDAGRTPEADEQADRAAEAREQRQDRRQPVDRVEDAGRVVEGDAPAPDAGEEDAAEGQRHHVLVALARAEDEE